MSEPVIIQGGMGAGVSNWRLANAVSRHGQLGVVSGVALDEILVRRLQDGDPGEHMRRALDHFPIPAMAEGIWQRFYRSGGRQPGEPYRRLPQVSMAPNREAQELQVVSNFVEIWLAREGHANPVGINYLEKIQFPHLASIFGAMLAGVDYVLMGAGIPLHIPGVLDRYARLEEAQYNINVAGATNAEQTAMRFRPLDFLPNGITELKRPKFLAIISSYTLALTLLKKASGRVDGFIIEGPTAGGHNAPPRGKMQLNEIGEPIYGERDAIDLSKLRALGAPFWLAGGYGSREGLTRALAEGAVGVQVGTIFALCEESGLCETHKKALLAEAVAGTARVLTDPLASPTGFPFKVAQLAGTASQPEIFAARPRICDLGYLREAYVKQDGSIGYRCPAEPASVYLAKGGKVEETVGRKCVCNGLMADIGLPQLRPGNREEPALVTMGDELPKTARFLRAGAASYSAADVIDELMQGERIPAAVVEAEELCGSATLSA